MRKNWKLLSGWKGKIPEMDLPAWFFDILANRGLKTKKEITSYLDPKYEDLMDPDQFLNMEEAVERIVQAREKQEKVVVYGDYDVDGITATALMFEIMSKIGVQKIETYIPHREEEGYGLNETALFDLISQGTTLIITVDCGITSKELIEKAKKKGVDVLVCDHHEIDPDKLPEDTIIIHPQLVKKGNEKQELSACGMAFFLARGLQQKFIDLYPLGQEKWLLDLVVLATICDVVPLIGQNRILAKYGLLVLRKTKRIGLLELMGQAAIRADDLNSYAVGFLLGPRINAAGRLDHAKKALALLLTNEKREAVMMAEELGKLNAERQKMCNRILEEAKAEIESSGKKEHEIFLLSNKNWPRGVVGIIASKLSDAYSRPVIVFEHDGKEHHGSARSVEGFDITGALSECEDCLLKFGGHAKAAGLTVSNDKFVLLSDKLLEITRNRIKKGSLKPNIIVDTKIKETNINDEMIDHILTLEPFGYGNKIPTFMTSEAAIQNVKKVGSKGEHLKFNLTKSGISAIFFGNSYVTDEHEKYDLAFELKYNYWNQRKSIEMRIIDLKVSK